MDSKNLVKKTKYYRIENVYLVSIVCIFESFFLMCTMSFQWIIKEISFYLPTLSHDQVEVINLYSSKEDLLFVTYISHISVL